MRLTTLARKINLTPKQLTAYLEKKEVKLENGIHSKLDKETIAMTLEKFPQADQDDNEVPDTSIDLEVDVDIDDIEQETKVAESAKKEPGPVQEEVLNFENSVPEPDDYSAPEEPKVGTVEDIESEEFEELDLIKVKKVKLEGIKVVGKIELPAKPAKPEKPSKQDSNEGDGKASKEQSTSKNRSFNRDRRKNRYAKNRKEMSYDEKLKEEERDKLKKRRRRENAERRRKQKYYEQHIEPKITKQAKHKKRKKPKESKHTSTRKEVVVRKNPIRRLWAWLNGEYDKY